MAVLQGEYAVGVIPRESSRVAWYFLRHGGEITCKMTGRRRRTELMARVCMEVPSHLQDFSKCHTVADDAISWNSIYYSDSSNLAAELEMGDTIPQLSIPPIPILPHDWVPCNSDTILRSRDVFWGAWNIWSICAIREVVFQGW